MSDTPSVLLALRLGSTPKPQWPDGVTPVRFNPDRHARACHALLSAAYASIGGAISPFDSWRTWLTSDAEYDPDVIFLARDENDDVIGFAHCWTSAFVKDLAVAADWRRKGVARALMLQAAEHFAARGADTLSLKVLANNEDARAFYAHLGMAPAS